MIQLTRKLLLIARRIHGKQLERSVEAHFKLAAKAEDDHSEALFHVAEAKAAVLAAEDTVRVKREQSDDAYTLAVSVHAAAVTEAGFAGIRINPDVQ
ncbi:hypothetical protein AVU67_gp14 [Ralstonia phage RSJ2]|uniref:Uncharacterized protein n=1 Tax=Ralstonia phage RSJ2 TaxID=1481785 RepID=A0A068Q6Y1_9CAUD|nr:hypothetical protein AVU67_gp14 [Ralstonia phage RSJ2]BAP15820.1 hypothetical protein [Ralstonia phage RSJ2]